MLACRRQRIGIVNDDIAPQPKNAVGQQHAQLPAAENANLLHDSTSVEPRSLSWTMAFPSRACLALDSVNVSSFFFSLSSLSDRILIANKAAFVAPLSPTAKVAVGKPPGICTMESRLSKPLSARDLTGTPNTGSGVSEEIMPGR